MKKKRKNRNSHSSTKSLIQPVHAGTATLIEPSIPPLSPSSTAPITAGIGREEPVLSPENDAIAPVFLDIASDTTRNEPTLSPVDDTIPPVSLDRDERIVEASYSRSSLASVHSIRESIPPATILSIAALALIVFLGGLLWWNSGETKDTGALPQTLSSEPLPDSGSPTSAPPAENTLASSPEPAAEQVSISEPGSETELMNIPSLPMNQQQGRHNQHNSAKANDSELPYQLPTPVEPAAPMPSLTSAPKSAPTLIPMPTPAQKQVAVPTPEPEPVEVQEPAEMLEPESDEMDTYPEMADTPARPATPPWLWQMRDDLSNCRSFFCRERVRRQYCTSRWSDLPECRGASF
ncbi:MAG: hypothetical protein FWG52_02655 [Proteobacteria bacterium]|nr:hypothetical protein [Pseudomonadota bacterium]